MKWQGGVTDGQILVFVLMRVQLPATTAFFTKHYNLLTTGWQKLGGKRAHHLMRCIWSCGFGLCVAED